MKKTLALVALAIAGFTFGFAGCGEDDDVGGGRTDTAPVTTDTTADTVLGDTDTLTSGTTTNGTTGDDDGDNSGSGGGGGDEDDSRGSGSGRGESRRPVAL